MSKLTTINALLDNIIDTVSVMDCSRIDGTKAKELIIKAIQAEGADLIKKEGEAW